MMKDGRNSTKPMERLKMNAAVERILHAEEKAEAGSDPVLNVVLVEPEIPPNTGNISRTCALVGARLHLVEPLGFSIDERSVKRAGLDYWDHLDVEVHPSLEAFLEKYGNQRLFLATTHGSVRYTDVRFEKGDFILFGKETAGLPKELIAEHPETAVRVPMGNDPDLRSLNLSNSVAVVVYEALRQLDFPGLV